MKGQTSGLLKDIDEGVYTDKQLSWAYGVPVKLISEVRESRKYAKANEQDKKNHQTN